MNVQICTGNYENYGVAKNKDILSFSQKTHKNAICNLLLYPKDGTQPLKIPMNPTEACNTLYQVGIQGLDWENYHYNFEIDGIERTDTHARRITGREIWGDKRRRPREEKAETFVPQKVRKKLELQEASQSRMDAQGNSFHIEEMKLKSSFYFSQFHWKEDKNPRISKQDMVLYKLHARGFSMGMKAADSRKGTFEAVERKLDYLEQLGVTTLLFLPIYEFEEVQTLENEKQKQMEHAINYWGYTTGNYFAPKAAYLGGDGNPDILKRLIQKIHQKQMEVVLEFYFDQKVNPHFMVEVLRFWKKEYHVDGFKLICEYPLAQLVAVDGMLSSCKLFYDGFTEDFCRKSTPVGPELFHYNDSFLYAVRKMLNHQNGSIYEFACQMRRQQEGQGFVNFVAENNGFTLSDVFSYNSKHNEENGEENQDGNDWNYSSNCGQEGISRKKSVLELRRRLIKNALAAVFFSQGVPLLWMGDECGNTQNGNNNAYCQDNEIGWKDWKNQGSSRHIQQYVKEIARLRREYPLLRNPLPFRLLDYENAGEPDLSYHSDSGWKMDFDMNRGFIGMFYSGQYAKNKEDSLYITYNFQNLDQRFALPSGLEWQLLLDTSREQSVPDQPLPLGTDKDILVKRQSICLFAGRAYPLPKQIRKRAPGSLAVKGDKV